MDNSGFLGTFSRSVTFSCADICSCSSSQLCYILSLTCSFHIESVGTRPRQLFLSILRTRAQQNILWLQITPPSFFFFFSSSTSPSAVVSIPYPHTHPPSGHPFGTIDTIAFFITLALSSCTTFISAQLSCWVCPA